jgi:tetratricopeptide (TPR) repeat protein
MLNLLIALTAGVLVTVLIKLLGFSIWAGIVPGVLALIGSYVFLARRVALKVQALSKAAEKELSAQPTNQRERQQRVEKAIRLLEEGLVYDRWQFLIGSEIHAQIGMIRYVAKDYPQAEVHLAKANSRNYMAKALHAALHYQRKEYDQMEKLFEAAVKAGKKEGVVWAAYAWCLSQLKEKEKAMKVMARAVEANPSDEKLKAGLTALQNDKRLRMKAFEPMWWQFGLEQPPLQQVPGGRRVQFQRR